MFELISSRCGIIFGIPSVLGFQPLSLHSLNLREKIHEVAGRILVLRTLEHASPTRLLDLRLSSCYRAACAMSSQPICPKSNFAALSTTLSHASNDGNLSSPKPRAKFPFQFPYSIFLSLFIRLHP
jgi:hypothetical protein